MTVLAETASEVPAWALWLLGIVAALIAAAIPAGIALLWSINNRIAKLDTDLAVVKAQMIDAHRLQTMERNIARIADRVKIELLQ